MVNFDHDPQLMLAILTEIVLETREITRDMMKKIYAKNFRSTKEYILEMMHYNTDYSGYKRPWSLTETEKKLYAADPHFQYTPKQRKALLDKVHEMMMGEHNLPKKQESPEE